MKIKNINDILNTLVRWIHLINTLIKLVLIFVLNGNIYQTLMNVLYGRLYFEIGGLECCVIIT